jgi:hypothetical protein
MIRQTSRGDLPLDPQRRACMKSLLGMGLVAPFAFRTAQSHSQEARSHGDGMLIDDFSTDDLRSRLGTRWRGVSDTVMGGISKVAIVRDTVDGRRCLRLQGDVRLENNGGFIQAALDLALQDKTLDASGYTGIRLVSRGNDERYSVHLRTPDNVRPWQSYRAQFKAGERWQTIDLPFNAFAPYRLGTPLDTARLKRIGLVAIGRAFRADLAVAELSFYH